MVLYLELFTEFSDHFVIEIGTIVRNDSFRDSVPTDQIMPDETRHDALGYCGIGSCLDPFREVIDWCFETGIDGCCGVSKIKSGFFY